MSFVSDHKPLPLSAEDAAALAEGARDPPSVGHIRKLEERLAKMTGKEAAVLFLTRTLANQSTLRALLHTHHNKKRHVVCARESHLSVTEQQSFELLQEHGAKLLPVPTKKYLTVALVKKALSGDDGESVGVVSLQNPGAGARSVPLQAVKKIAAEAAKNDVRLHLDGVRLFHACVQSQVELDEFCSHFDAITLTLASGVRAPAGYMVCGTTALVNQVRRFRDAMGGHAPLVSAPYAAVALKALDSPWKEQVAEDSANATVLAHGLEDLGFDVSEPETNEVRAETDEEDWNDLQAKLIKANPRFRVRIVDETTARLFTSAHTPRSMIDAFLGCLEDIMDGGDGMAAAAAGKPSGVPRGRKAGGSGKEPKQAAPAVAPVAAATPGGGGSPADDKQKRLAAARAEQDAQLKRDQEEALKRLEERRAQRARDKAEKEKREREEAAREAKAAAAKKPAATPPAAVPDLKVDVPASGSSSSSSVGDDGERGIDTGLASDEAEMARKEEERLMRSFTRLMSPRGGSPETSPTAAGGSGGSGGGGGGMGSPSSNRLSTSSSSTTNKKTTTTTMTPPPKHLGQAPSKPRAAPSVDRSNIDEGHIETGLSSSASEDDKSRREEERLGKFFSRMITTPRGGSSPGSGQSPTSPRGDEFASQLVHGSSAGSSPASSLGEVPAQPPPARPVTRTVEGVLGSCGLGSYAAQFKDEGVDYETLLELTTDDLDDLGMPTDDQLTLLQAMSQHR